MPPSEYLLPAARGLSEMSRALDAALPGAKVAADDENLPMRARSALREAVVAVEHARRKVAEASSAVSEGKKMMGSRDA